MTKIHEKELAIRLRQKGESIGFIAKKLGVSKGSASYWCKDIVLSQKQLMIIAKRSKHRATLGLLIASEKKREERQKNILNSTKVGIEAVGKLSLRDLFMIGLGLYWGEGYKKGNQEFGFTNSDISMIRLYIKWLEKIYKVPKSRLILRITINNEHQFRITQVEKYWALNTGVPVSQFTKPSFVSSSSRKKYLVPESHYGTLRIKVRMGTSLRREVLGSIAALQHFI